MKPFSHCHYCGNHTKNAKVTVDGLQCWACGNIMYMNPTPVGVLIIPAEDCGVYTVRRGIPPFEGGLALPGGFQTYTDLRQETWQQTAVREAIEEINVDCRAEHDPDLKLINHVLTRTGYNDHGIEPRLLVVGTYLGSPKVGEFTKNEEAEDRVIIYPDSTEQLVFSIHRQALAKYWNDKQISHNVVL